MKCPNCGKDIANDSQFCEFCGKKTNFVTTATLPKEKSKGKRNWWSAVSFVLFLSTIVCGWFAYDYKTQLDNEIRTLESVKSSLEYEVNHLREIVPKSYKTKYNNQNLYDRNCSGSFSKKDCFYDKDIVVSIYTQDNGYGLTEWGWIPMSKLEKY